MKKLAPAVLVILLIPLSLSRAQDQIGSTGEFFLFSIGNSHTWDFRPSADFLEIARSMKLEIKNGWHINCGQNLETIWQEPEQTCVDLSEYGVYRDAIANHRWDAITIQTFTGGTGKGEKEAVQNMLDLFALSINKDCNVYIYCSWPKNTAAQLDDFDYQETWIGGFEENDTLEKWLLEQPFVLECKRNDDRFSLDFNGNETQQADLLKRLIENGFPVVEFHGKTETLEDAFMSITEGITR